MSNSAWPSPGWNWTAEYQTSGIPFVTSSFGVDTNPRRIDFDFVTRDITIDNAGTDSLRVGFSHNGVNGTGGDNYFLVRANTTVTFEVRVKNVFLRANSSTTNCSLLAGCTTIPAKQMPHLSGSMSGSINWRGV
mgnify:CR=1 FL=1